MSSAELYTKVKAQGGIAELPRAKFRLTGADRVRYLNGQVSNDVRKLSSDIAMYACVMTAKGKMCADVFISSGEDYLLVDAELVLRESLAARLERYIISDDVTLEDVTDEFSLVHAFGISDPDFTAGLSPLLKRKAGRLGIEGWDLLFKRDERDERDNALAALREKFPVADEELLETIRIEAGIPRWGHELSEETIPVEAGLDRTAIDYNKGCYIGQEVISRLKSIGHVNKQLGGFVSADGRTLEAGMRLHVPEEPGRDAGWLTSAAYSFNLEKPVALGYLKRGITAGTLVARAANEAGDQNARPVLVKQLPLIP